MTRRGALPGGVGEAMGLLSAPLPTVILRYPSGRYGFAGSVPVELTEEPRGLFGARPSKSYATEQEAIQALLSVGVRRFQLADCSWFDAGAKA
jgi:hypothetical protein